MGGGETARFLIGSALTAYDGETTIGNLGVLEAPTRQAARPWRATPSHAPALGIRRDRRAGSHLQLHRIDRMTQWTTYPPIHTQEPVRDKPGQATR